MIETDPTCGRRIDAYTHCPLCGSPRLERADSDGRVCADCGHGLFNTPVAAVGTLILDARDRLFLVRRAKDPAKGKLGFPGGFVDPGESFEDAARREILEEVGLRVDALRYLCSGPNRYVYQGFVNPVCDAFFTTRLEDFDVVLDQNEIDDWTLRPLESIDPAEIAFASMRFALLRLKEIHRTSFRENRMG